MNLIGGLSNKGVLGDGSVVQNSKGCPLTVIQRVVQ